MTYLRLVFFGILAAIVVGCGTSDSTLIGNPAPDFSLLDANGNTVSLSDFGSQPVLLYFHMAVG